MDQTSGILAVGPWQAERIECSWSEQQYEPSEAHTARADAALKKLQARGSPSHDGAAGRLVDFSADEKLLAIKMQPARWALRLVEGELRDWWQDAEGVAGQEDDVLRVTAFGHRLDDVLDVIDRVADPGVFGFRLVVEIDRAVGLDREADDRLQLFRGAMEIIAVFWIDGLAVAAEAILVDRKSVV